MIINVYQEKERDVKERYKDNVIKSWSSLNNGSDGSMEFKNVSFAYDNNVDSNILDNVLFKV